ncbi:ATP synthase F0 subunit B [Blastopirellula marina]|uniref:ATP synthase subunit b n=1 Tax=Blastopirellula marina TaxID=124 RepID=A0A2S8GE50_9BACT|nr:ATP synthase F0 subunit B [Blastopirellula marina]PQO42738.1 hypothetical protein C5Y98_00865 [Blastopirellula marina]PTL46504.1 hypothetical protein C5Y97_00865 [Blastopirellula marina]
MRNALLQPKPWSTFAGVLLIGFLFAPAWAQDTEKEEHAAEAQPMAAAEHAAPEKKEDLHDEMKEIVADIAAGDLEAAEEVAHGHDDDGHNENDLSHNDPSDSLADPLAFQLELSLFTLFVFLGLVIVLGYFAWGPIVAALKAREESMEGKMKKAEEMYEQAKAKLDEYTRKLSEAQQEIKQTRDEMIQLADQKAKQIEEAAQKSAHATMERATREIEAAKGAAINELAQASVNLAVELAGEITRKELTAEDHANLIQDSISKLPSTN